MTGVGIGKIVKNVMTQFVSDRKSITLICRVTRYEDIEIPQPANFQRTSLCLIIPEVIEYYPATKFFNYPADIKIFRIQKRLGGLLADR